jgi:hypothetical protein
MFPQSEFRSARGQETTPGEKFDGFIPKLLDQRSILSQFGDSMRLIFWQIQSGSDGRLRSTWPDEFGEYLFTRILLRHGQLLTIFENAPYWWECAELISDTLTKTES